VFRLGGMGGMEDFVGFCVKIDFNMNRCASYWFIKFERVGKEKKS
jgi:hypothetical protein